MKVTIPILVIAAVLLTVIGLLLIFGFSDWGGRSFANYELWQTKPWRPYARLTFSVPMISLVCLLGGVWIRTTFRH